MAIWEIENEQGEVFEVEMEGDTPPTDMEIEAIIQETGRDTRLEQLRTEIAEQPKGISGQTELLKQRIAEKGGIGPVVGELGEQGIVGGKLPQAIGGFTDVAGLGAPSAMMQKAGISPIDPKTPGEHASKIGGQVAGFTVGAPGRLLKGGQKLLGKMGIEGLKKDVLSMTATAAAFTPDTPDGDLLAMKERAVNALITAPLVGVGSGAVRVGSAVSKAMSPKLMAQFEKQLQDTLYSVKRAASDKFKQDLISTARLQPGKVVSLEKSLGRMIDSLDDSPALKNLVNRVPKLKKLLTDPKAGSNITILEAQAIKNRMNELVAKGARRAKDTAHTLSSEERVILDSIDDINADILRAVPRLKDAYGKYSQFINPYNRIKDYFKFGKTLDTIRGNFKDPQVLQEAKKVLPADIINKIGGTSKAVNFMDAAKRSGMYWLIAAGLGGFGVAKLLGGGDNDFAGGQ